ncbi:unnamed protein product [Peniophora sp. CBMAI 1063]|nr:unnamed protein product [Peniophora sp. CBMAI 1063]
MSSICPPEGNGTSTPQTVLAQDSYDSRSGRPSTSARAASHNLPPALDFEHYFVEQTFDGLCGDISLLTYYLKGHRSGDPDSVKSSDQGAAQFWSGLSFILDAGDLNSNINGSAVVAVTGQVLHDRVISGIFARKGTCCVSQDVDGGAPKTKRTVNVDPVRPAGRGTAEALLESYHTATPVPFAIHLQDIVTLMDYMTSSPPNRDTALWTRVLRMSAFILRRTHVKHCARLLNRRNIWTECPILLMQKWYRDNDVNFADTTAIVKAERDWIGLFNRNGIQSNGNDHTYPVTVENAQSWLDIFSEILNFMEDQLSMVKKQGKRRGQRVSRPEPPSDVKKLCVRVMALDALLKAKVLDTIITGDLARHLGCMYGRGMAKRSRMSDLSKSTEEADEAEDVGEYEPDDDMEAAEDSRQHVIRYLKTLTAAYSAVTHLVWRAAQRGQVPLATYRFDIDPPVVKISEETVTGFRTRFLDVFNDSPRYREAADTFLNRNRVDVRQISYKTAVHAEAALMGIAYASTFHSPQVPQPVDPAQPERAALDVFPSNRQDAIAIGVSKKCCFCCHMLAELLAHRTEHVDSPRPRFVLPGTHATILPWTAPAVGVPLGVLREMRTRLLHILHSAASSAQSQQASNQTSPAFSSNDFESVLPSDLMSIF